MKQINTYLQTAVFNDLFPHRRSRVLHPSAPSSSNGLYFPTASGPGATARADLGEVEESSWKDDITNEIEGMKDAVAGMDRRLAFHINIVAENMGKMAATVEAVKDAFLIPIVYL